MPLPETTPDRRRFGLRHAVQRLFAPIRDDDRVAALDEDQRRLLRVALEEVA